MFYEGSGGLNLGTHTFPQALLFIVYITERVGVLNPRDILGVFLE